MTDKLTPEHLRALTHAFLQGSPTHKGLENLFRFAAAWEAERTDLLRVVETGRLLDAHLGSMTQILHPNISSSIMQFRDALDALAAHKKEFGDESD